MRAIQLAVAMGLALTATVGCGSEVGSGGPAADRGEAVARTSSAICTTAGLSSNVNGNEAVAGNPVTFTATAGCSAGDTPTYEFYELAPGGSWTLVQAYGAADTFVWDTSAATVGTYDFEVWIRAQGSTAAYESYADTSFDITGGCANAVLSASPGSPSPVGTAVTLSATSASCANPLYEFYEQAPGGAWTVAQAWSSSSTFNWSTTGAVAGTYNFEVWAKDSSSNAEYDAYDGTSYTLTTGTPVTCTNGGLTTAPASPQQTGTAVTLTASSSTCSNPQYEFYELAPGGSWTVAQAWSSTSTFAWTTTGATTGTYEFQVWVRDSSSTNPYDTYSSMAYTLTSGAPPPACTAGTITATPSSPQPAGTGVTLAAGSSTCPNPLYEFLEEAPGGAWAVVQAWSTTSSFAFSSATAGTYSFEVWIKDSSSGATYDTYADDSYVLQSSPPGLVFATQEATAMCNAYIGCCPGGADGGTSYNLQNCISNLRDYGWEGTLPANEAVYNRGNITLNSSKTAGCLSALQAFPCGTQTAAQWATITDACEGVFQGTIAVGQGGCVSSFECAPSSYCDPTVDGGLCTPLATQGQPCNTVINTDIDPLPDQMCSYLASGSPAMFCDLINNQPDAATCQPVLANGALCQNNTTGYYDDQACPASGPMCGDNGLCGGTSTYPVISGFCTAYAVVDAGADAADAGAGD